MPVHLKVKCDAAEGKVPLPTTPHGDRIEGVRDFGPCGKCDDANSTEALLCAVTPPCHRSHTLPRCIVNISLQTFFNMSGYGISFPIFH